MSYMWTVEYDMYEFDLGNTFNYAEMAYLIAPRPLCAESGERDPIFPIQASRRSFARVKEIYEVFAAGEQVQHETFDDVHTFYGVKGLPFLAQHL